jgi:hypothetical protein
MASDWTEGPTQRQASEFRLTLENMAADGFLVSDDALRKVAARPRAGELDLHDAEKELVKESNPRD